MLSIYIYVVSLLLFTPHYLDPSQIMAPTHANLPAPGAAGEILTPYAVTAHDWHMNLRFLFTPTHNFVIGAA